MLHYSVITTQNIQSPSWRYNLVQLYIEYSNTPRNWHLSPLVVYQLHFVWFIENKNDCIEAAMVCLSCSFSPPFPVLFLQLLLWKQLPASKRNLILRVGGGCACILLTLSRHLPLFLLHQARPLFFLSLLVSVLSLSGLPTVISLFFICYLKYREHFNWYVIVTRLVRKRVLWNIAGKIYYSGFKLLPLKFSAVDFIFVNWNKLTWRG
jgi:hypothetical protein